jgi:hypothetical protein
MTDEAKDAEGPGGDRRGQSRRRNDRRARDRRLPLPWWRRPWALVSMGALVALLLVAVFGSSRRDRGLPRTDEALLVDTAPRPPAVQPVAVGPAEDAASGAAFERLLAEGEAAVGRLVRVELYCSAINPVSVRAVEHVHPSLQALTDTATRKVPAAECKWGRERDVRRDDLMLIVPADLAERFARSPMVEDRFVQRRRVRAEIEWLGRSDALALRPAGVLRALD